MWIGTNDGTIKWRSEMNDWLKYATQSENRNRDKVEVTK